MVQESEIQAALEAELARRSTFENPLFKRLKTILDECIQYAHEQGPNSTFHYRLGRRLKGWDSALRHDPVKYTDEIRQIISKARDQNEGAEQKRATGIIAWVRAWVRRKLK